MQYVRTGIAGPVVAWQVDSLSSAAGKGIGAQLSSMFGFRRSMPKPGSADIPAMKQIVHSALLEIASFASANSQQMWAEVFKIAIEKLSSANPEEDLPFPDFAPADVFTLETRQLMAAAQTGYVCAWAGSWNDLSFASATKRQFEALSLRLYKCLNDSFMVLANSGLE